MFELAEMHGVLNPFEMEINHRVFLWWKAYKELKLTQLHDKNEYYFAKLIMVVSSIAGHKMSLDEALVKFKEIDQEQEEIDAEHDADAFVSKAKRTQKRM